MRTRNTGGRVIKRSPVAKQQWSLRGGSGKIRLAIEAQICRHCQKDRLKNRLHRFVSPRVNRMTGNCTPLKSPPKKAFMRFQVRVDGFRSV